MKNILSSKMDEIANTLESKGFVKEAEELDIISNSLDRMAAGQIDQAIMTVMQADPQEIQQAINQLKGGRVASEEKDAGKAGNLMAALALLAGLIGSPLAGDGQQWRGKEKYDPHVTEETKRTLSGRPLGQKMSPEKLKDRAEQLSRSQVDLAEFDKAMAELGGKKQQTDWMLGENTTPDRSRPAPKGQYNPGRPTQQRADEQLDLVNKMNPNFFNPQVKR